MRDSFSQQQWLVIICYQGSDAYLHNWSLIFIDYYLSNAFSSTLFLNEGYLPMGNISIYYMHEFNDFPVINKTSLSQFPNVTMAASIGHRQQSRLQM